MTALAERKDPFLGAHFFVEIDSIDHGGFTECSGLEVETEVFEYKEGGQNEFVHKLPGRSSYKNISLKWGLTDSRALWEWRQNVIRGQIERKNLSIVLYDSEQQEVKRWNVREAYPVKWVGASFNATTPAVAIESLELAHHGFEEQ